MIKLVAGQRNCNSYFNMCPKPQNSVKMRKTEPHISCQVEEMQHDAAHVCISVYVYFYLCFCFCICGFEIRKTKSHVLGQVELRRYSTMRHMLVFLDFD